MRVTSACRVTSAFRNWSNQARNCTSSGFLTFASNAAPTTIFCAVSRSASSPSGATPQHQQSLFERSAHDVTPGMKIAFYASLAGFKKLSWHNARQITKRPYTISTRFSKRFAGLKENYKKALRQKWRSSSQHENYLQKQRRQRRSFRCLSFRFTDA